MRVGTTGAFLLRRSLILWSLYGTSQAEFCQHCVAELFRLVAECGSIVGQRRAGQRTQGRSASALDSARGGSGAGLFSQR